jgi:hypothetical protein
VTESCLESRSGDPGNADAAGKAMTRPMRASLHGSAIAGLIENLSTPLLCRSTLDAKGFRP